MSLWISLYLPTLSLDVGFPHWPADAVAAMLEKDRISACTPAAYAQGVTPGMSAGTAQAMVPALQLAHTPPGVRQQYLEGIALAMLQYTPSLACFREQAILMEVQASLSLFRGPAALCRRIRATLRTLDARALLGMAPTALGAWILSRQAGRRRRVLGASALQQRLDALPTDVLPAAQPHADWLEGIGCQSLGALRQLPRKPLQQRSSPLLLQDLDAAYGLRPHDFPWFEPPYEFSQQIELMEHLEHTGAILTASMHLVEQLCGWLQARQMGVRGLDLLLHHEKGWHACPPTCLALRLSESAWRPRDFAQILHEQMQRLALPAPVISLTLCATQAEPRLQASTSLFPEPSQWQRQEQHLLDLLRARLGEQAVRRSHPLASHLPEHANQWAPLQAAHAGKPDARTQPACLPAHTRPFWMLVQPLALGMRGNNPVHRNMSLRLIQGPERLESEWWGEAGHQQRDYFIAQDPQGARYWIYLERETTQAGWYLHGLFG